MTRIASQLGRTPLPDVAEGVRAIVSLEKRGTGYALTLRTEAGKARGERVIEGRDCRELSEAATLIVALSVEEADQQRAQAAPVRPEQAIERAASVEAKPAAHSTAPAAAQIGFALRPELMVELGLLRHNPTLGPGLAFALELGRYRAELAGTWLAYGDMRTGGERIALRLGAARVSGCVLFGAGRLRGGPCVGVELGSVRAMSRDTGVDNRTFWGAGTLAGRLSLALWARLSLVFDADLVASWGRLGFVRRSENSDGSARRETLRHSFPVQGRTHLGLELGF